MSLPNTQPAPRDPQAFGGDQSVQLRAYLPAMPDDMQLTAREVSLILSPHQPSVFVVYQLRKEGRLKGKKAYGRLWFSAAEVRDLLSDSSTSGSIDG